MKPDFDGECHDVESPPAFCAAGMDALTLTPLSPIRACTGQEVDVTLEVTGGDGPFEWLSRAEIPDLTLDPSSSRRTRLRGTLLEAGNFELTIGVRNADSCANFQVFLDVSSTPAITARFPEACVGQLFALDLTASGGDPAKYQWTVAGAPELSVNGSRLSGRAPLEAGRREVTLALRDDRCPPGGDPVQSVVSWDVKGSGECPRASTTSLPAPCQGIEYSEPLVAADGSGSGYVWTTLNDSLPDGLAFDSERGLVHGTPTGASRQGSLELSLTDSAGQQAIASLNMSLRSDCWVAHVSGEPARLHVGDVLFSGAEVVLPHSLPEGELVSDLKLSPDGNWIAFRAGGPAAPRLYLYALGSEPAVDATALTFDCPSPACPVLDYAWSAGSDQLAVILGSATPELDSVSGFNVTAPSGPWPVVSTVTLDTGDVPLDYLRDLTWTPQGRFAFVAGTADVFAPEVVFSIPDQLAAAPQSEQAIGNLLSVRATPAGWLAFSGFSYSVVGRNLADDFALHGTAWVSPSGGYVATTDDGTLSLLALGQEPPPIAASEPGACRVIIAWASTPGGTERIVCSNGENILAPNGEEVRVFDYRPGQSQFEPARGRSMPENSVYVPSALANTPRRFSPAGDWLLIGAPSTSAALARIPSGTSALPPPINAVSISGPAETVFAPDGRWLFVYDQYGLRRSPIPPGLGGSALSSDADDQLVPPPPLFACEEELWVSPDNWCGAPRSLSHFAVSGDSQSVLFEGGDGSLWLTELSAVPQRAARRVAARLAPCPVSCAGVTYAFQP